MVSIAIIGATGGVGKELIRSLLEYSLVNGPAASTAIIKDLPRLDKVIAYVRRETTIDDYLAKKTPELEAAFTSTIKTVVIDFDNMPQDLGKDCDIFISCMGSLIGEVGKEGQYKIDHDYPVNAAKIARQNGVKVAAMCSAVGASTGSYFFYNKTRGETEEHIKEINFSSFTIARPGVIKTARPKRGIAERTVIAIFSVVDFADFLSVSAYDIAQGMLYPSLRAVQKVLAGEAVEKKVEILGSRELASRSAEFSAKRKKELKKSASQISNQGTTTQPASST
eukprot:Blabericola_migrator_1__1970@NODE_1538_length_4323_cov_95_575893_g1011_i0_p3_GENE_NODE_1538_length_4323_cov_95_575893_g1011_i0NODE_1538_length_4323_cov_95_575893_g1011_i0_p3_ORF_typecomplete_len281_score76_54HIM1/PF08732_10/3_8e23NAD_binding_10/PF13460_6/9_9e12NmrA/PF05368_13/5_8e09Semialdhyde_dh/PF01118_24/3_2e05Semialdhyde_dh/PF01118_24/8_2e03Epimerase/PF01370_21/0_0014Sacchrp_dh_NADP/PF03435_18/0_0069DapB_N/PF01113_20/0_06RmlD_sub_bind/PF04321_17/0_25NAD_binding_4/PF07993_12/0_48_NODE_1538_le